MLDDIAQVEQVRLKPRSEVEKAVKGLETSMAEPLRSIFIQSTWDRNPLLAEDLAEAYLAAVAQAKELAGESWGQDRNRPMGPHRWRRHVKYLRDHGLTDDDIRFAVAELTREDEDGNSPIIKMMPEIEVLREATGAPHAFLRRARFDTEAGKLAVCALHELAWIERHVSVAKMLRPG